MCVKSSRTSSGDAVECICRCIQSGAHRGSVDVQLGISEVPPDPPHLGRFGEGCGTRPARGSHGPRYGEVGQQKTSILIPSGSKAKNA